MILSCDTHLGVAVDEQDYALGRIQGSVGHKGNVQAYKGQMCKYMLMVAYKWIDVNIC